VCIQCGVTKIYLQEIVSLNNILALQMSIDMIPAQNVKKVIITVFLFLREVRQCAFNVGRPKLICKQ
jgi:hypothetical protein